MKTKQNIRHGLRVLSRWHTDIRGIKIGCRITDSHNWELFTYFISDFTAKRPPLARSTNTSTPVANWFNSFVFQSGRKLDSKAVSHPQDFPADKIMSTSIQQALYLRDIRNAHRGNVVKTLHANGCP